MTYHLSIPNALKSYTSTLAVVPPTITSCKFIYLREIIYNKIE